MRSTLGNTASIGGPPALSTPTTLITLKRHSKRHQQTTPRLNSIGQRIATFQLENREDLKFVRTKQSRFREPSVELLIVRPSKLYNAHLSTSSYKMYANRDCCKQKNMHLAVGEAVAKAASVKLAAMALVVFVSAAAALCVLRLPRVPRELGIVEKASDEIATLEKRAKRLEYNLALARESAREAFLKREAEKNGDLAAPFWPGCVFFPCNLINMTATAEN